MYKAVERFIQRSMHENALRFGSFTLKSGRQSPYFFDASKFSNGLSLIYLGMQYAYLIKDWIPGKIDVVFGLAYKGILLSIATSFELSHREQQPVHWSFNRKEEKDHGEGGNIVGDLYGNVIIVDDVITSGSSIREAYDIIRKAGAKPIGAVVALDRQEKGTGDKSALSELEEELKIPIHSIVKFEDLIAYCDSDALFRKHYLPRMIEYRNEWCVIDEH